MIKLPEGYNYIEIYFTLRCNLNCRYCINEDGGVKRIREELKPEEWATYLNQIDYNGLPLTIGGGEPTIRKDEFYKLIDGLRPDINIDLLTNLTFNVNEFLEKVDPLKFNRRTNDAYKSIRVSYHPASMDPYKLVEKAEILQDNGFPVGIFGINHPENVDKNVLMSEISRKKSIYFFIKDFLGVYNNHMFGYYKYPEAINGARQTCKCKTSEVLIGPEGNIYKCHYDLYRSVDPIANICEIGKPTYFDIDCKYRLCNNYGMCNPCDIKIKTNRFLQMGRCNVDIKDIKKSIGSIPNGY